MADVLETIVEQACAGEAASLTPSQCALLADSLPVGDRFQAVERLVALLQHISAEQFEQAAAAHQHESAHGRAERAARGLKLASAEREELHALRAENAMLRQRLLEFDAARTWPSLSKASRCALAGHGRDVAPDIVPRSRGRQFLPWREMPVRSHVLLTPPPVPSAQAVTSQGLCSLRAVGGSMPSFDEQSRSRWRGSRPVIEARVLRRAE